MAAADVAVLPAPDPGTYVPQLLKILAFPQRHRNKFRGVIEGFVTAGLVEHQASSFARGRTVIGADGDLQSPHRPLQMDDVMGLRPSRVQQGEDPLSLDHQVVIHLVLMDVVLLKAIVIRRGRCRTAMNHHIGSIRPGDSCIEERHGGRFAEEMNRDEVQSHGQTPHTPTL